MNGVSTPPADDRSRAAAQQQETAAKESSVSDNERGAATHGSDLADKELAVDGDVGPDAEKRALADGDGGRIHAVNSVNNVASVPNGGLAAWLQVVGAFVLFLNTWYDRAAVGVSTAVED